MTSLLSMNIQEMEKAILSGRATKSMFSHSPRAYTGFKGKLSAVRYWLEDSAHLLCISYVENIGVVDYQYYEKELEKKFEEKSL